MIIYFLAYLRFVGMMFAATLFFATASPMPLRFMFAAVLGTMAVNALANDPSAAVPLVLFDSWLSIFLLALREIAIGVSLGLLMELPLLALQVSGEQISMAMGFSMASVMDPLTQRQSSVVGQLQFLLGLWFYFRWNGHLLFIQAVMESLRLVPLGSLAWLPKGDMNIGTWLSDAFRMAMKMVIPYYCSIMLADVGLGFLARTVPQMNIFILGLPIKVALGFFVLAAVLPRAIEIVHASLEDFVAFALRNLSAWF
ncbi:MAG: flagellar biosynthetic protein FliR [Synergistaceae bacterium]|nr:flagellar biosynthetic protein FliR [Synergistaceae bacterium]